MQQKYDIYEKELYAVLRALKHWRPYLTWGKHQFIVLTDHANLTFWKHPWKLNDCTMRWHAKLQDYDFVIHHVRGKVNSAADALSQSDNMEKCKEWEPMTVLDVKMFANVSLLKPDTTTMLIQQSQHRDHLLMKQWQEEYHTGYVRDPNGDFTYWQDAEEAVIPPNIDLKQHLMDIHHNHPTAGHLGQDKTIKVLRQHYFWPGLAK